MKDIKTINTFVIPHLNYPNLKRTLISLHKYNPVKFNVILVDQSNKYEEYSSLVTVHIRCKNLGFAGAVNRGLRLADTQYVTVWNDDAELINKRWWDGIIETFERYGEQALGVNPSSPRNPKASGDIPINAEGFDYKEEFTDIDYNDMIEKLGKGHIIDGICTWGTVFNKEKLDKVAGTIQGKAWLDENFFPGGGEDYDLNRRAYLTKNEDNHHRGYRMLGTGLSFAWHWWYSTKHPDTGKTGVKHCGTAYHDKWGVDADLFGQNGKKFIPNNIIRQYN